MDLAFKLYPRGFTFSDFQVNNIPNFYETEILLDKYYYSFCNDTDRLIYENNNHFIIIHGNSTFVHYEKEIDNTELPKYLLNLYIKNYTGFLDTIDFVAGRYAIIIGNHSKVKVYQDATASRTVYYSLKYNFISSHAHLINDNIEHKLNKEVSISPKLGINWNISPFTNIKALTPNLCLEVYSKDVQRFFPRSNNRYAHLPEEERFTLVEKLWKSQQKYFLQKFQEIAFSITGGIDSRVSLAMLKNEMSKMKFFTYMTELDNSENEKNKRLLRNDGSKVKELLEDIPLNHRFIKLENTSGKLSDRNLETIKKNTVGKHNYGLLRRYKTLFPDENTLHIRSNLTEIASANLMENNTGNNLERVKKYFANFYYKENKKQMDNSDIDLKSIAENGIENFKYNTELYDYHIMDLYYWENRSGRWIAEIINETDVCFETFSSFNLRSIIEIALSFPFQQRKNKYFIKELINRNYPVLNFYGVNTPQNLYEDNKELKNLLMNESTGNDELRKYAQKSSEKIYDKIKLLRDENPSQSIKYKNQLDHILMINQENIERMSNRVIARNNEYSTLFSKFDISDGKSTYEYYTENLNSLHIPANLLLENNYAELKYKFGKTKGLLKLSLLSDYSNDIEKDILEYRIEVNEEIILREDISDWKYINDIHLYNLSEDDIITIKIKVLKDVYNSAAWSSASLLEILNIEEYKIDNLIPVNIKASSPYSKMLHE